MLSRSVKSRSWQVILGNCDEIVEQNRYAVEILKDPL